MPPSCGASLRALRRRGPELVLHVSRDGVRFRRVGPVLRVPRGAHAGPAYVVYDRGLFRAWYSLFRAGEDGRLVYAESRDGTAFTAVGGFRGQSAS